MGAASRKRLVPPAVPERLDRLLDEPAARAQVRRAESPSASGRRAWLVLKGKWRYLEHDWIATEGSYVFEPPGETHTLYVPEDVEEMITYFQVNGVMYYCDPYGNFTGYEDVFTKLEMCREHFDRVGLGASYVDQFVR